MSAVLQYVKVNKLRIHPSVTQPQAVLFLTHSFIYDIIPLKGGVFMTLNPDCVRDILLIIEKYEKVMFPNDYPELRKYSYEEITYHVKQCNNAELFEVFRKYVDDGFGVIDLSPKGHDFLSKIRADTAWSKIKSNLQSIAICSVMSLIDNVLGNII